MSSCSYIESESYVVGDDKIIEDFFFKQLANSIKFKRYFLDRMKTTVVFLNSGTKQQLIKSCSRIS